MDIDKILDLKNFIKSDIINFPFFECTESYPNKNVFYSNKKYLCILLSESKGYEFLICSPYIWEHKDYTGLGWFSGKDIYTAKYFDNFDNPAHQIGIDCIIAYKEVDEKFIEEFLEFREDFINILWDKRKKFFPDEFKV